MSTLAPLTESNDVAELVYPSSDGKRMADSTKQADVMVLWKNNIEAIFAEQEDVFVAIDLLWYPVKGSPRICTALDGFVVFGRPKGERESYRQWVEGDIAPQVVFEYISKTNTVEEMIRKQAFYTRHGVEEIYYYDLDTYSLMGWIRNEEVLDSIDPMEGWKSPRLGITFTKDDEGKLVLLKPDGTPFDNFTLLQREKKEAEEEIERLRQRLREAGLSPD